MKKDDVKANSLDTPPRRPVMEWRAGNVKVAIWSNKKETAEGGELEFKTVSLTRSYRKTNEDIWRHDVINLRRNDLQKAIIVLQKAQEVLLLNTEHTDKEE